MTKRAVYFLIAALTLWLVALSTGTGLYYLLFNVMLAMLVLGAASSALTLYTLKAKIKCPKRSVERGKSIPVNVVVRHMGVIPVKCVSLSLSVPDDCAVPERLDFTVPPFSDEVYAFDIDCPHRGIYRVGLDAISVTDIFGLIKLKRKSVSCSFEVEALPKITELDAMRLSNSESSENRIARMTEDYAMPSGVRDWRTGDALKKVHWKLSMRKRELMVRTYEESARPDTLVLIDLYPIGSFKSHALTTQDAVIETAASIAVSQLKAGYPVRMPLMAARPTEMRGDSQQSAGAFIRELARVKFDSPYQFEQVLTLETRRMQRTGGAVLVTPRLTSRLVDFASRLKMANMSVCVCWITDNSREEAAMTISRLRTAGIMAFKIDPWGQGLTKKSMIEEEYELAK